LAACGGKPSAQPTGRPQDVAKATFEALKAGGIGPLEPHLMTPEEAKRIMTVALDDSVERERWERMIVHGHERLPVDWATAKLGATKVKLDAMGGRANVTFGITSEKGTVSLEIEVLKVGQRYVFQELKLPKGVPPPKEAAPAGDEEEEGCGGD
jgi:hypothetical protein